MSKKKEYWFRAKDYGWGWGLPLTWQGWLSFLTFAVILVCSLSLLIFPYTDSSVPLANWVIFFSIFALDVFMLVAVSYRYGETPEWRWKGKKLQTKKKGKKVGRR